MTSEVLQKFVGQSPLPPVPPLNQNRVPCPPPRAFPPGPSASPSAWLSRGRDPRCAKPVVKEQRLFVAPRFPGLSWPHAPSGPAPQTLAAWPLSSGGQRDLCWVNSTAQPRQESGAAVPRALDCANEVSFSEVAKMSVHAESSPPARVTAVASKIKILQNQKLSKFFFLTLLQQS